MPSFRSPVNIPITLNGNFGELRSTHFHAGIDIKTNGTTGLPVLAADDGFVSRISISPVGYGNALYIEHPSGYTTVYGHLERFTPEIAKWVHEEQYRRKSFKLDIKPGKNMFPVKKGDVIAYSGNSGSSGGPHLHFEIRNTETEHSINPLLFPIKVSDKTPPAIQNLVVYPLSDDSQVDGHVSKKVVKVVKTGSQFGLQGAQPLKVYGEIGFGLEAVDYLDGSWSKCGIYKLELFVDSVLVHRFALDSIDFATNNDYYSHIDYGLKQSMGKYLHRSYTDPGNKLFNYTFKSNRGRYTFDDGKTHKIEYRAYDAKGNLSKLKFSVVSTKPLKHAEKKAVAHFSYQKANSYETDNCKISIPQGALFDDIDFTFFTDDSYKGAYSPIFKINNTQTPLRGSMEISIKANQVPENLREKAIIVSIVPSTWKKSSIGGAYSWGWVKAQARSFGNYCISVDTIVPSIVAMSIKEKTTLTEPGKLRFKITDDLSGIQSYTGFVDGDWVLFEYDAKNDMITYHFDNHIVKGKKHIIDLVVIDAKQNTNRYSATFFW